MARYFLQTDAGSGRGRFRWIVMSESDRKRVAYHEAGHAVANRRFGILQAKATILSRDGYAGAVVWEGKEHVWSANEAPAQVLSYCAGYAALVSIGVERDIALQGCSNDMEAAAELIARWPLSGTLDEWQSKAVELMSRPENIRAVDLVANALLRHETLNDVYLDMLVEFADGNITDQEWERFVTWHPGMAKYR